MFLPGVALTHAQLVERARAAEAAGFAGMVGMDHLMAGTADIWPTHEAMITNTWIAAHTARLRIGSLVMCDSFRHPAMLAREAVALDHASGGRFDLGIGWGSFTRELEAFDIGSPRPGPRIGRLRETLDIVKALWLGDTVDYEGRHFSLRGARLLPPPLGRIPIVIGGEGRTTLSLVAEHADWWNLHYRALDQLEELRPLAGDARVSMQVPVAFVISNNARASIIETARAQFAVLEPMVGTADELVESLGELAARGIERLYVWFHDSGLPDTLATFGDDVIQKLAGVLS
jgi:alkanesulfonate monooxygenase SsuD/methylene tetrahydromethanopterin reductase-like flavin-dependent oxidoreductase (luciferase family)